jgi:putative transposase
MNLNHVYFWTDTIKDWKHLLKRDEYKKMIIDCLKWLVDRNKIKVYGFVIMPNHLHLLWEMIEMNGKEMPHASFNKWTSKNFLNSLQKNHPSVLSYFSEVTNERNYRFWQSDALAILVDNENKLVQKLNYIHNNPLNARWNLASSPELYKWSSASFYSTDIDTFGFLTHYKERC